MCKSKRERRLRDSLIFTLKKAIILLFFISTRSVDKPVINFLRDGLSHEPVSLFFILRKIYTIKFLFPINSFQQTPAWIVRFGRCLKVNAMTVP
jgi:hypothetical protein